MAKDVRGMLQAMAEGTKELATERPDVMGAFRNYMGTIEGNGPLDVKTKELIAIAISVYCRCEYCIVYHTFSAFKNGATREEILDAASTAMIYGGGPTQAYISATLMPCLDEFEKDFKVEEKPAKAAKKTTAAKAVKKEAPAKAAKKEPAAKTTKKATTRKTKKEA